MRPRSAAVIALRIYATVLTVQVVTAIVSYLATSGQLGVTGQFWAVVGTRLVVAFFLWIGADAITRLMVGGLEDETPAAPYRTVNIHAVALSIVGIVLIAQGILALVSAVVTEIEFGRVAPLTSNGQFLTSGRGATILVAVVTLAVGTVLVFGAGGIARGLSQRYPEPEEDAGPPIAGG